METCTVKQLRDALAEFPDDTKVVSYIDNGHCLPMMLYDLSWLSASFQESAGKEVCLLVAPPDGYYIAKQVEGDKLGVLIDHDTCVKAHADYVVVEPAQSQA
jgi:hypothetical protein